MTPAISRIAVLRILVLLTVIVVLSVPVLYSYFVYTPTVNLQCGICHTMQFYVTNISKPHAKYSCLVCHEISIGGIANMMWAYAIERPDALMVFEKYHPRKNLLNQCQQCHVEVEKLAIHRSHLSTVKTLGTCSVCHAIHIQELDKSCGKCHPYLETVEKHMKMHGVSTLQLFAADCGKCHSPQSPAYVPPANTCLEAMIEGKTCLACHAQLPPPDITDKYCTSCHYK